MLLVRRGCGQRAARWSRQALLSSPRSSISKLKNFCWSPLALARPPDAPPTLPLILRDTNSCARRPFHPPPTEVQYLESPTWIAEWMRHHCVGTVTSVGGCFFFFFFSERKRSVKLLSLPGCDGSQLALCRMHMKAMRRFQIVNCTPSPIPSRLLPPFSFTLRRLCYALVVAHSCL